VRRFLFLIDETPTFALQVMSSIAERLRAASASGKAIDHRSNDPTDKSLRYEHAFDIDRTDL
jgi:CRP-like cAMP-binding protein